MLRMEGIELKMTGIGVNMEEVQLKMKGIESQIMGIRLTMDEIQLKIKGLVKIIPSLELSLTFYFLREAWTTFFLRPYHFL